MVSDNKEQAPDAVNAKQATVLIESSLPNIKAFLEKQLPVLKAYQNAIDQGHGMWTHITRHHHCTESIKTQLQRLVKRIHARKLETLVSLDALDRLANAKEVLQYLNELLLNEPIFVPDNTLNFASNSSE